jgi:prepilin-type N-terminal cleavage/methylation domain-containing protein
LTRTQDRTNGYNGCDANCWPIDKLRAGYRLALKRNDRMARRNGFTLIELMVAIGIIVLLAGILLVGVSRARRKAAIAAEQLDFQAIETALGSYNDDFGSYPENIQLTTWNSALAGPTPPQAPVQYLSLAAALLGPGPGAPQSIGTAAVFTAGDGADGPGFRSQTMNIPGTAGGTTITFNTPQSSLPVFTAGQSVWWFDQITTLSSGVVAHTYYGITNITQPPSPTNSVTGISWSSGAGTPTSSGVLRIAAGRVWGPYLPPDKFQVAYVDPTRVGKAADVATNIHYPVLLDRWGGEIQYFPAYGPANNRASNAANSSYSANATTLGFTVPVPEVINVGPLIGYAAPATIDTAVPVLNTPNGATLSGFYSIFDQRDGAPVIDTVSPAGPEAIPWCFYTYQNPRPSTTIPPQTTTDLSLAVKWMLGDDNLNDVIDNGESYRNTQPYILISAGPDGPDRSDGGFCDFSQISANSSNQIYQKAMEASGNIYNFDRQ